MLLLGLEEQPGPGFVDGRRREGVDGDGAGDERECRERRPAPLVEHLDVVDQVGLGTLVHPGVAGRGRGRRAGLRGRLKRRQFGHGGSFVDVRFDCQKYLRGIMMVSPGLTGSPRSAFSSLLTPLTSRTILMRFIAPSSLTPPASESACSTVVSFWMM